MPWASTTANDGLASERVTAASEGMPARGSSPSRDGGSQRSAWPAPVSCTRNRDSTVGVQRTGINSPSRWLICDDGAPRKQTSEPSLSISHFFSRVRASSLRKTSALWPRMTIW